MPHPWGWTMWHFKSPFLTNMEHVPLTLFPRGSLWHESALKLRGFLGPICTLPSDRSSASAQVDNFKATETKSLILLFNRHRLGLQDLTPNRPTALSVIYLCSNFKRCDVSLPSQCIMFWRWHVCDHHRKQLSIQYVFRFMMYQK